MRKLVFKFLLMKIFLIKLEHNVHRDNITENDLSYFVIGVNQGSFVFHIRESIHHITFRRNYTFIINEQ